MKTKFLLGAAAGAIVLAGVTFSVAPTESGNKGAPFLHPLMIAQSLCGENADELSKRRAFFIRAARAYAQSEGGEAPMGDAPTVFGDIAYEITSANAEAQDWFDQGLAHTWNFNHGQAIKAFKKAQEADPTCAMCYWGEAFAHGPNINAPMFPEAMEPAFAAVQQALALKDGASEKEQALIDALAQRYAENPPEDRSPLDNAFADAMDAVAIQFPDDDFVAALAAEANMDTQAWDYWIDGGRLPKGRTARTISLLEGVLARNPTYPAAIHLYIHITEASRDPYRAAEHADKLAGLSPGLGHLIHMPSHTYYRIGRFKDSLAHNIEAVATDEAYLENADASILYEYGYFTHNIHFAMTSAMMSGDGETALSMATKLDDKLPIDMAAAAPWVQPIKASPYYAAVQFGDPADIMAMETPGEEMPFLKAAWHYARGEALVKMGDNDAARAEAEAIGNIITNADMTNLTDGGVPALDILNIARLTVIGRASAADGDIDTGIEALSEAVDLQDAIAYTEPPYWYYPAKQTLASMVLQAGNHERAEQLFLESLTESPNNAWVLYGLAESYKAQGDKSAAKYADALFKDAWAGGKKAKLTLSAL